ncbi:MAG: hypothetical protein RL701_3918 [Pseudomonadota bacterium]
MLALAQHYAGRFRVRRIAAAEVCASDAWHADTALLAFPGGADLPYAKLLNGAGNASISRYVSGGGALLGVCAGAYYACARVAWEVRAASEVSGVRELALFAGTARGSLHALAEPYSLEHLQCATVTKLSADGTSLDLHALYWGGPEFVPDEHARYTPLLRYVMPGDRTALAAVALDVGRGRVVLTGVHAEITGEQFPIEVSRFGEDSFDWGMRVSAELTKLDAQRRDTLALTLNALGV